MARKIISDEKLVALSLLIVKELKKEFTEHKLSGNLLNTISVTREGEKIQVIIPAKTYNMLRYQTTGVLVHTGNRSYASKLDDVGSEFNVYNRDGRYLYRAKPHNHVGYIERCIRKAIEEWKTMYSIPMSSARFI